RGDPARTPSRSPERSHRQHRNGGARERGRPPPPGSLRRGRPAARAGRRDVTIERVFVAGAGLMGHGIAQVHAAIGKDVTLYEPDLSRAEAGRGRVADNLARAVAKGRLTEADRAAILARIHPTNKLDRAA